MFVPNMFGDLEIQVMKPGGSGRYFVKFSIGKIYRIYTLDVMRNICLNILKQIKSAEDSHNENSQNENLKEQNLIKRFNIA